MAVNKDITPVVSPILSQGVEIGKNVFWGASQAGDASGGTITFYMLNPIVSNNDMYYSLDNYGVVTSTYGKMFLFATNIGSWGDPGLTGPSGTVYIDNDMSSATTGAKIARFERPYYLGKVNQASASYAMYINFSNENLVTYQVWLRAKIFYAPRLA